MSIPGKARKADLIVLATELGIEIPPNAIIADLKSLILKSEHYEEVYIRDCVNTIIQEREERERAKAEREKFEVEERSKQQEREHELKMRELELKSKAPTNPVEITAPNLADGRDRIGNPFLGYLKAMKGVIYDPPEQAEEWPFFFYHAEKMFKLFEVPEQYQGKIILNCLKDYARGLNTILKDEDWDNYEKIIAFVLKEQRITPLHYKKNFDLCGKRSNETYSQYASRVTAALELYLKSRNVENFEKLKELIVADKIKTALPFHAKSHIHLKETENWLPVTDLVQEIDNFLISVPQNPSNFYHTHKENNFHSNTKLNDLTRSRIPYQGELKTRKKFDEKEKESGIFNKKGEAQDIKIGSRKVIKCYKCQEEGHLKRFCPKEKKVAQVAKTEESDSEKKGLNEVSVKMSNAAFDWEIPVGEADGELLRINLRVGSHKLQGIIDSGAEITVLRKSFVPEELLQSSGKIFLRPAIGPSVEANLVTIPLSLWTEEQDIQPRVQVEVAVVEGLHEEALVTPKVYEVLREQKKKYLGEESEIKSTEETPEEAIFNLEGRSSTDESSQEPNLENSEVEVKTTPVETNISAEEINRIERNIETESPPLSQVQKLRKEQLACPTLQNYWTDARKAKNNYWIESDLLYHSGKVGGQKYVQLVVPECRRREILKLAHETPTGGHLAAKKTRDRIAMSFWWEGMPGDAKKFCTSCHDCQLRRRTKVKDRAPIEAVGRPELPFQVVNADILGPIVPKTSRGHQYVLCVIDQHSRWPEAIPIKSLTAKATCDAFMEIFTRTGIPRVIAMDNGTNFASKLTQEFLKRLGAVPKFSTPGYPQSNGLVERWVGTMKSMLHHAIRS